MSFIGKATEFLFPGAVKFNPVPEPVPCTTNQPFCQPTQQNDQIAFQLLVSESTELITNGDFNDGVTGWDGFGGWSRVVSSGQATMVQVASVNTLPQKGILTVTDHYRVDITVSNFTSGIILVGGGTGSVIKDTALVIQSNGTFTAYFTYTEFGAGDFIIQGAGPLSIGTRVDDVSVIKVSDTSDYDIEIIDQETGAVLDTVPTANTNLVENVLTVDFNWADDLSVSNGCRQIQVIDNTNLLEDDMSTNQGWTITSDIAFTGTRMLYTSTGVLGEAVIADFLTPGVTYEFTMITSGMTGTGTVTIRAGNASGVTRSTNNTFVEQITADGNGQLLLRFTGAAASTAGVDNLVIKQVNNIVGRTGCYDLQTTHDCTLFFVWSNSQSWGGFNYSPNAAGAVGTFPTFVQRLRLEAKFRGRKYPSQREIGEDSAGTSSMDYTSLIIDKILDIHRAPDYLHDAIASFFVQDFRTIGGISYLMRDDYEPSPPSDSVVLWKDLMTSRSEIQETTQPNQINRNV